MVASQSVRLFYLPCNQIKNLHRSGQMGSVIFLFNSMTWPTLQLSRTVWITRSPKKRSAAQCRGFTLLEVLVALVIVATSLGASLRAVSSLTQNSSGLRHQMMATWSAENRLTQIRLLGLWPEPGRHQFSCPQGNLALLCEEEVSATLNRRFRRVVVTVTHADQPHHRLVSLTQLVPHVL